MDKRIIGVVIVSTVIVVGFLIAQVVSLNNQLSKEKEYSTRLDKIDEQIFNLSGEGLIASGDSIVCANTGDITCLDNNTANINGYTEEVKKLSEKRASLKQNYGK